MIKFLFPTIMIILLLLLFYRDRKPCQRSRVTNEVHLVGRVSSSPFYSFWDRQNFFVPSCRQRSRSRCRRWARFSVSFRGKRFFGRPAKNFQMRISSRQKKPASYFGSVLVVGIVIDYFDVKEEREKKGSLYLNLSSHVDSREPILSTESNERRLS